MIENVLTRPNGAGAKINGCQGCAICKAVIPKRQRGASKGNRLQGAAAEGIAADVGDASRKNQGFDAVHFAVPGSPGSRVIVPHCSGAGDGENAVGGQHPGQIFAAGAAGDLACGAVGLPGEGTAVAFPGDVFPGAVAVRIIHRGGNVTEDTGGKCGSVAGEGDAGQTAAVSERIAINAGYAARDSDTGEAATAGKCVGADAGYTLRDGDAGEAAAALKHSGANAGDTLRNGDASETAAIIKRGVGNTGDTLRDGDIGQVFAAREGIGTYAGHTLRDGIATTFPGRNGENFGAGLVEQNAVH